MHDDHGPRTVRVVQWGWDRDDQRRSGLPWFGIFLLLFGGILLAEQLFPGARIASSALVLAVGLAFLVSWLSSRRTSALYVGTILTALALSDALSNIGAIHGPGWGTLFLGIGFLFIGFVRAATRGGWGWQLVLGAILAASGGGQIAEREVPGFAQLGSVVWPIAIILFGLYLVVRSQRRGDGLRGSFWQD